MCVYDGEWSFPSVDVQIPVELDQDPLEIPVCLVSSVKWNEIMVKYQENVTSGFFSPLIFCSLPVYSQWNMCAKHYPTKKRVLTMYLDAILLVFHLPKKN